MDFEEHELVTSKGFATDESLKAVVDIIDEHYPSARRDCLRLLNQLLINEDRNLAAAALQELSDRTPLIAYPLIRQICAASDEVRALYVDNASFEQLEQMMKNAPPYLDNTHPLKYHIELVRLLALCTRGKNGSTELKCASEIPMDHIVRVVTSESCLIEVKMAYFQFLLHCYIDTDAEMKDAYKPEYVDAFLRNMLVDVQKLQSELTAKSTSSNCAILEQYICVTATEILLKFFEKPYSEQAKVDIHVSCTT
ncbi:hypothetical protein OESDEN_15055 [Oesophagostomum dentatum]|uniref:Uncharacterized protein n=1 Tax=Oesophagostomum dentatum TaxID=61180 RepID=A0A0B1SIS5_OESDE|nr:hypothetical protein OESDEN_15055 [Oesophagostomum dentatum]